MLLCNQTIRNLILNVLSIFVQVLVPVVWRSIIYDDDEAVLDELADVEAGVRHGDLIDLYMRNLLSFKQLKVCYLISIGS